MPTVKITAEQAAALADGESITVYPPRITHIAVAPDGCVYEVRDGKPERALGSDCTSGHYRAIRNPGSESEPPSWMPGLFRHDRYTVTPVEE